MVKPKPLPPNFRVVDTSAWVKLSKILCCLSSGIPTPVSATSNRTSIFLMSALCNVSSLMMLALKVTPPFSVNLMALPIKLASTWRNTKASPFTFSKPSVTHSSSLMPLVNACARNSSKVSSKACSAEKATCSMVNLRASIFVKSSTLFKSDNNSFDELSSVLSKSCWSALSGVVLKSVLMPIMPFSGVLISWLIFATKRVFA